MSNPIGALTFARISLGEASPRGELLVYLFDSGRLVFLHEYSALVKSSLTV